MSKKQPTRAGRAVAPAPVAGEPRPESGSLPDELLGGAFGRLDPALPLLLLPVRLETRYELAADPPELRIRIYPDQVQIDADRPAPSEVERDLAKAFWTQRYVATGEAGRRGAWQRFVGEVGSNRAGHIARLLRPTEGEGGALTFPAVRLAPARPAPARPALLPKRWLAIGYAGGAQIFRQTSRPVDPRLRTGPDPAAPPLELSGGGLKVDDGLAWMLDYQRAVDAGMAITVPLTGEAAQARDRVDVLLVVGVLEDVAPEAASAAFARLLDAHSRAGGLAFVPQGTPTNNTETAASGWSPEEADLVALEERELTLPAQAPARGSDDNAARLAAALGLADASALRRLAHGADPEFARSQQMRTALFEAVLGTLTRQLLDVGATNGLGPSAIAALRGWFIDHVTGGAPVPTVRIGPQPYGILPVRRSAARPDLATTAGQVERVVALLIDMWRESAARLPTTGGRQTDGPDADTADATIPTILATQPHPARLFLRRLSAYEQEGPAGLLRNLYEAAWDELEAAASHQGQTTHRIAATAALFRELYVNQHPGGFATIDQQLDLWGQVAAGLRNDPARKASAQDLAFVDGMLLMLRGYEGRQRPLRWLGLEQYEGVLGEENTALIAGLLHGSSAEWGEVGLVQSPDAGPGVAAAAYLADLRRRFDERRPGASLPPSRLSRTLSPKPLLYQLLALTLPLAPDQPAVKRQLLAALDGLAAVDPGDLEWLLRESLGLGAHRLDAWATSLASERLARLRQARPTGLQIGAFGWVTQLQPRRQRRPSEGFVHAPSLAHATTAAILRAGWHAHGDDRPLSPFALSLTSERVRTAAWLLDGVRQGQPLGDLLGYRFERALHDHGADAQIRPVRQLVLAAGDRPDAAADQPVDGVELLALFRTNRRGTIKAPVSDTLLDLAPVRSALLELEATFDAVNDVGAFEAVHQLAAGNYERAGAMLDALSLGTGEPPELRAPLTPRSAVAVEHRVVILLRADSAHPGRGWRPGVRDTIAPALERWVASLLPPASQVGFRTAALAGDGAPRSTTELTLERLELSALDALYLIGDDPATPPAALCTLAAAAASSATGVRIDPDTTGSPVRLADFTALAVELRRILETLRPADARDLRLADAPGEAGADAAGALKAIEALLAEVGPLLGRLGAAIEQRRPADVASAVSRLARLGISTGAAPGDLDGAAALRELAAHRMAGVTAIAVDPQDRQPGLEQRLAALLAQRVPALGLFTLAGTADTPVVDLTGGLADPLDVDEWLDAVGRVRADVGRLTGAGMLSELLGAGGLALSAGQHPVAPGEGWAANSRPVGTGRLSVVAVSGPGGPPAPGQRACGLVVDQWSDAIPSDRQVTGLAFQYDAPSNRPPQAWLLAVTPDGEPWTLKLVTDTLLETLEWATLRAVAPEDLSDYGRAIPTIFAPGDLLNWPREPSL